MTYSAIRYAHGQRVIYPHPGSRIIEIMDFSLAACFEKSASFLYSKYPCQTGGELVSALMKIPKTLSSGSPTNLSTSYSSLVLPPTVLKASPMSAFRTDVETRLPCRVSRKALPTTYYAHMLYEEGIVGIQVCQNTNSYTQLTGFDVYSCSFLADGAGQFEVARIFNLNDLSVYAPVGFLMKFTYISRCSLLR